jgi:anti-sigma regulatory factor (Ser/Thr protein kinase)
MTSQLFLVPKEHTLEAILQLSNELAGYTGEAPEYIFDFQSGSGYTTPFGMLYLGFAIRQFAATRHGAKITARNMDKTNYAAHMGFYHCCGFEVGNPPGKAKGSNTYLPVTILKVEELREQARRDAREVGDVIEERSQQLARILTQEELGTTNEVIAYSLREMIRNVVEHSQSNEVAYCAQYHPLKKQAELAILDTGVGVRATLTQNPHLTIHDDREALNLAVMPGISSKMYKGIKKREYDVWQNSGYGLFAVSRLCGHEGKFLIVSGDKALSLKPDHREYHEANFAGTAVRLNLSSKNISSLTKTMKVIMQEGDEIARSLKAVENDHAPVASRMLASEFSKPKK